MYSHQYPSSYKRNTRSRTNICSLIHSPPRTTNPVTNTNTFRNNVSSLATFPFLFFSSSDQPISKLRNCPSSLDQPTSTVSKGQKGGQSASNECFFRFPMHRKARTTRVIKLPLIMPNNSCSLVKYVNFDKEVFSNTRLSLLAKLLDSQYINATSVCSFINLLPANMMTPDDNNSLLSLFDLPLSSRHGQPIMASKFYTILLTNICLFFYISFGKAHPLSTSYRNIIKTTSIPHYSFQNNYN